MLAPALLTHTAERTSKTTPSDSRFKDMIVLSFVMTLDCQVEICEMGEIVSTANEWISRAATR
jgi:hypothetical protein